MTTLYVSSSISYSAASLMIDAAVEAALVDNSVVCVAVLDNRGGLKAFAAMDGSSVISSDMCQHKAYTALLGLSSESLGEAIQSPPMLASFAAQDRVALIGGGLPIMMGGQVVGAIGVGGALAEQDIAFAQAGLTALASIEQP